MAAHGDPSQDESGEKMPCPGSWSNQTCFALRNKGQYRCDACLHVPYEGCYAERTVYIKSLGKSYCALCHVGYLTETRQGPCVGPGCANERARCARMMLRLLRGQCPALLPNAPAPLPNAPAPPPGIDLPVNPFEGMCNPPPAISMPVSVLPRRVLLPQPPPQPVTVRPVDVPQPPPLVVKVPPKVQPKPPTGYRWSAVSTQTEIEPGAAASSTDGGLAGAPAAPRKPFVYLTHELIETQTALRNAQREIERLAARLTDLETAALDPEWQRVQAPEPAVACRTLSHSMPVPTSRNLIVLPRRVVKSLPGEFKYEDI